MKVDLLYLCHGRLDFTRASLANLLRQTDPSLINEFVIYNDASPDDGATAAFLRETIADIPAVVLRETEIGSPVGVMAHFLERCRAELFAKIDNDIIVPSGWLNVMLGVMERNPDLELLGMEPGMSGFQPSEDGNVIYGYLNASHIGGVGLMRRSVFQRLPDLIPNGRFGFTEWQHNWNPVRGWVQPDLRMFSLDFLPIEPWRSLTATYMKQPGLQRDWPKYDPKMSWHWEWWTG